MRKNFLKNIDWTLVIIPIILTIIGIISIYSASMQVEHIEFYKQFQWVSIAIPFLIIAISVDYLDISKFSIAGYIISILLLVGVLFMPALNGARSWYPLGSFLFQPSELTKIFLIIFLALHVSKIQVRSNNEINKIKNLITSGIIALFPIILVAMQPDYGTALAYVFIFATIMFLGGIKKRYIFIGLILAAIVLVSLFAFVLPKYAPHALKRFTTFLNPESDPRGDGYNTIQSKIAVGSGQIFGMGLKEGTQTQLGYLYPKTTDFIFSVISEEMGFVISGLIIILYTIMIVRIFTVAKTAKDKIGSYISSGVGIVMAYYVIQNIGMTMGLLPITGIPLPFLSYGGSSTITNFILLGLVINISGRRKRTILRGE